MKIGKDFEILDGLPVLYIKNISSIICADR